MDTIGARMGASQVGRKSGYLHDTAAHIPPAGLVTAVDGQGTAACLVYEERPVTPPEQRRYRQSLVHEPGKIVRHPGRALDALGQGPFGRETVQPPDEKVELVMKQLPGSDLLQWKQAREEDIYAR